MLALGGASKNFGTVIRKENTQTLCLQNRDDFQRSSTKRQHLTPDTSHLTLLSLGHPIARHFKDSPFPFGEALDSVLGDFVENRVHLTADEFLRGQIRDVGLRMPGRPFDGCRFD